MFIDTHTHLFSNSFDQDIDEVINRAIKSGVELFLLPNIDLDSIPLMHNLESMYPNNCFAMMGLHPCSIDEKWEQNLKVIKQHIFSREYIAIGEIGVDLYWDKKYVEEQIEAFKVQVEWAKKIEKPIVIHARDSLREIFDVLDIMDDDNLSGVFHCFSGTLEDAIKINSYNNFKLGIGGVITYKNSNLDSIIKNISLDELILETDSPYLSPKPYRGKRNESSYLLHIAEKLADIYNLPLSEIERKTTETAKQLFKLPNIE